MSQSQYRTIVALLCLIAAGVSEDHLVSLGFHVLSFIYMVRALTAAWRPR